VSGHRTKWAGPLYRRVAVKEAEQLRGCSELELRLWVEARIGPQSARLGVGRFSPAMAAEDLGVTPAELRAALATLCRRLSWRYEESTRWLYVPSALVVAWDGSPAQLTGYKREVERLDPPATLMEQFAANVARLLGNDQTSPEASRGARTDHRGDLSPEVLGDLPPDDGGSVHVLVQVPVQVLEQEHELSLSPSAPRPTAQHLQAIWNESTSAPIPRCREITAQRRKHAEARLRDRGLDVMRQVFERINANAFLRGESERGWCANFDWALKPANITKVLEGAYDGTPRRTGGPGRTGAPQPGKYSGVVQRDALDMERAS
jgi:hypothetical protein